MFYDGYGWGEMNYYSCDRVFIMDGWGAVKCFIYIYDRMKVRLLGGIIKDNQGNHRRYM